MIACYCRIIKLIIVVFVEFTIDATSTAHQSPSNHVDSIIVLIIIIGNTIITINHVLANLCYCVICVISWHQSCVDGVSNCSITIEVVLDGVAWVGVGFSSDEEMIGSDAVM
jgi:formate hydrogenlyase subunit 4